VSWTDRIARRLGFVREQRSTTSYAGAHIGRLTASWAATNQRTNAALYRDLLTLQARSRDLYRNNDYARRFVSLVVKNVIGPSGMSLQVQALRPDGTLDVIDSSYLEGGFGKWARRGEFEITGRYTWGEFQRLLVQRLVLDGEVLVRRHLGEGRYGVRYQLVSAERVDPRHNEDRPGGVRIRMGVEIDELNRPLAYWLTKDQSTQVMTGTNRVTDRMRVPASEIRHLFLPHDVDQLRGEPWMASAMRRMRDLDGYEEAAVIAARVGAAKMGVLAKTAEADVASLGTQPTEDARLPQISAEPGEFMGLPEGYSLQEWSPQYPHEQFGAFVTACLRGIASGLDVAYHNLANDVERVNYSSARVGVLEERETWKALQGWLIDAFYAPMYSEWLDTALTVGALNLPRSRRDKFDAALWQGRRWQWVDPMKDLQAAELAIRNGLTTRGRIIREQGLDPEEVWRELEAENARLANVLPQRESPPQPQQVDDDE
jgi:lambda family phage portal protein